MSEREKILIDAMRDILNGLYALRDHAKDEYGPDFGKVEQQLIDLGIKVLKQVEVTK